MKCKLRDIATVRSGYSFRGRVEHDPAGDIRVLSMKDMSTDGQMLDDDVLLQHSENLDNLQTHQIVHQEILFQSRGTNHFSAIYDAKKAANQGLKSIAGTGIMRIQANQDNVNPEYLVWFLRQQRTRARLRALATGTQIPFISRAELEMFSIQLPALEQQNKVVAISQLRHQQKQLREKLEEATDAIVNQQCWNLAIDEK
ncbi:MAG: restriction endonuclease subunit S [Arenicella sp.]